MQGGREESHIGRTPKLEVRKQDHRLKLCCLLLALVPDALTITWRSCRNDENPDEASKTEEVAQG